MNNLYNRESNKFCALLNCIALFSLSLTVMASIIIYYYYGINSLINFNEDKDICTGIVWNYSVSSLILIMLLMFTFINTITSRKVLLKTKTISILFQGLVWLILAIWGIIVTNDNNCQIKEKTIYLFARITSILQMIISIFIFSGGIISLRG